MFIGTRILFALLLGSVCSLSTFAESPALSHNQVISLEPSASATDSDQRLTPQGRPMPQAPANFHRFREAHTGELADAEQLTLRFAQTTKLTHIAATGDFRVEQGSSCVEGNVYQAQGSCMLLVRFTPRGAGNRLGRLTINHSASATPFYVGLGGYGYAAVISFTPATITTLPETFVSNQGVLTSALNLAVDGGDTVYVADTGNNLIRLIDSSGTLTNFSSSVSAPSGVAVDSFGEIFFSEPAKNFLYEIFVYGPTVQASGTGTDTCTTSAPCKMAAEQVYSPGALSIDPYDQLFFVDGFGGASVSLVQPYPPTLAHLSDPFTYATSPSQAFAVDASDTLYTSTNTSGGYGCQIISQTYNNAANGVATYNKVAGGRNCGLSGDGGQARNAELGNTVGQIAFDVAGNLYFTDTANQRVRRIDAATGIISIIAGSGTSGTGGDGGEATQARLSYPSGVGVDSQGQVYVISDSPAGSTHQVLRQLGTTGFLSFPSQVKGTSSAASLVTLSNTGNSTLTFTKAVITGADASDFSIDSNTTSCLLTAGSTLANGLSCKVGIIFKPGASGTRTATLTFLDNTVTSSNSVTLSGVATLPAANFAITAPASGTKVAPGTAVKFSVSVTSSSGTAPTGTVQFAVDGAAYGSPVTIASGAASVNLTGLTTKTHSLGATYNGDSNYAPAGPITRSLIVGTTVTKGATSVQLSAASLAADACAPIALSATVIAETSGTPTGTVQLEEGGKAIASATLYKGSAVLTMPASAAGAYTVRAHYWGDATHAPSLSPALQEVVPSSCGSAASAGSSGD